MALTVEDGTGLSTADAYASLTFVNTWHTAQGNTTWTGTDAAKEAAIRRATVVLSGIAWPGIPVRGRDQALAWPRGWVADRDGFAVSATSVPIEVQQANAALALQELVDPGSLSPVVIAAEAVKRAKAGPVEVEFSGSATGASASRPLLTQVADLLARLIGGGGLSAIAGRTARV